MISSKIRFEVLKRGNFRCGYCGKNGKDVTLEIDHIIPKANGGRDDIENLMCCCRECNMGKGKTELGKVDKNLYKKKIDEIVKKLKEYFYTEWNNNYMGMVDDKTYMLLCIYFNNMIKGNDGNNYMSYVNIPPLFGPNSPYGKDYRTVDTAKMVALFQEGGEFCDKVLNFMYEEYRDYTITTLIEEIFDDNYWYPKNDISKNKYSFRLNYNLTKYLDEIMDKKYIIYKYTLYPKLIQNG